VFLLPDHVQYRAPASYSYCTVQTVSCLPDLTPPLFCSLVSSQLSLSLVASATNEPLFLTAVAIPSAHHCQLLLACAAASGASSSSSSSAIDGASDSEA
jgi:hypothetical protein